MRSLIVFLAKQGVSAVVDFNRFWTLATAAYYFPNVYQIGLNSKKYDQSYLKSNLEIFTEYCQQEGITEIPTSVNEDFIFKVFEEINAKHEVILDFSADFTCIQYQQFYWGIIELEKIQELLLVLHRICHQAVLF